MDNNLDYNNEYVTGILNDTSLSDEQRKDKIIQYEQQLKTARDQAITSNLEQFLLKFPKTSTVQREKLFNTYLNQDLKKPYQVIIKEIETHGYIDDNHNENLIQQLKEYRAKLEAQKQEINQNNVLSDDQSQSNSYGGATKTLGSSSSRFSGSPHLRGLINDDLESRNGFVDAAVLAALTSIAGIIFFVTVF